MKATSSGSKKPSSDDDDGLTQSERFMQAARELECDDDPERFKERVRKVAKSNSPSAKGDEQLVINREP